MKQYLVGLRTGGLQECPEVEHSNHEVIEAESEEEARKIYNKKHNCSFFYGQVRGEVINGHVLVPIDQFLRS